MCTAINLHSKYHYFGRNLDYERTFGEGVTVTPRNFEFKFRNTENLSSHYAIIGMAAISEGYALYFDTTNEKGLSMAGLNFPKFAEYKPLDDKKINLAPHEFMPYILAQCEDVNDCKRILKNINIEDFSFSKELPNTPMHWIISDKRCSITVEPLKGGIKVYDNPIEVLTNSPDFNMHLFNLNNYMSLSIKNPENKFSDRLELEVYTLGMGALGLPGDLSSMSRFVKASFVKENINLTGCEEDDISQFFHILYSVYQQRGLSYAENGTLEYTNYTSCCNADRGIYYYTTYNNSSISAVCMYNEDLDTEELIFYPLKTTQNILMQN